MSGPTNAASKKGYLDLSYSKSASINKMVIRTFKIAYTKQIIFKTLQNSLSRSLFICKNQLALGE
jgi:hypothetical protein